MAGDEGVERARLLPHRRFPSYAYVPGRAPHPVRDPAGHSFGQEALPVSEPSLDTEEFAWGLDLFNHGYYWEAHEAWEPIWRAAGQDDPRRLLLKGLILLAAAGVKVRQRKPKATARHAGRAAALFRAVEARAPDLAGAIGLSVGALATRAQDIAMAADGAPPTTTADTPEPVYPFVLGRGLERCASNS